MYIVSAIFSHTVSTMTSARALASTASRNYHSTVDILDATTGEVLVSYHNGHRIEG